MAAPKNLSAGQIINQLRRAEVALANGKRVKQVCRELGVSEQTYYRWRKEYGGMKVNQAKRFKRVESATALIWKLLLVAEKRFRRLDAPHLLKDVF